MEWPEALQLGARVGQGHRQPVGASEECALARGGGVPGRHAPHPEHDLKIREASAEPLDQATRRILAGTGQCADHHRRRIALLDERDDLADQEVRDAISR
jgi:hypothetical protein